MNRGRYIVVLWLILGLPCFCLAEEKKETAQQEVKDFSFVQYEKGGTEKWKMNGKSAEVLDNKVNIEYLSALSFGKGTMLKLKAKEGSFDKGENIVHLRDNVVIASTDGTRLTTDNLMWDADTRNVSTETSVNIRRPDMEITGIGVICDIEGKTAELKHDINAAINSSEPGVLSTASGGGTEPLDLSGDNVHKGIQGNAEQMKLAEGKNRELKTTITCDGPLELNYRQNKAFFHGNVKVMDSKGNILADRIDVYFNPVTRRVKCVVGRGNVRIINGENVTYSEKAIYLVDQGRVILPDRPRLVIQNNIDSQR